MNFNTFFFLFLAILFSLSQALNSAPLLNAIVCIETFADKKDPKKPLIHLFHDIHGNYLPKQEKAIKKGLAQEKGHTYIEDPSELINSKAIKEGCILPNTKDNLKGVVGRFKKAGLSATGIECRAGFVYNTRNTPQEIIDDFKNIVEAEKVPNPSNTLEELNNNILKLSENRSQKYLEKFEKGIDSVNRPTNKASWFNQITWLLKNYNRLAEHKKQARLQWFDESSIGLEVMDMIALKKLCEKDEENKYKALIAGAIHCNNIGLCLENLGYTRVKCVGTNEEVEKTFFETYESLLHGQKTYVDTALAEDFPGQPLSKHVIKNYFTKNSTSQ